MRDWAQTMLKTTINTGLTCPSHKEDKLVKEDGIALGDMMNWFDDQLSIVKDMWVFVSTPSAQLAKNFRTVSS